VQSKGLASKILSRVARQLPQDSPNAGEFELNILKTSSTDDGFLNQIHLRSGIGWRVTVTHRCYSKPLSSLNATVVLATKQLIGSTSVAQLVAAKSPPVASRLSQRRIFGSILYARTSLPFCFGSALWVGRMFTSKFPESDS
jgi:hypothetical protein